MKALSVECTFSQNACWQTWHTCPPSCLSGITRWHTECPQLHWTSDGLYHAKSQTAVWLQRNCRIVNMCLLIHLISSMSAAVELHQGWMFETCTAEKNKSMMMWFCRIMLKGVGDPASYHATPPAGIPPTNQNTFRFTISSLWVRTCLFFLSASVSPVMDRQPALDGPLMWPSACWDKVLSKLKISNMNEYTSAQGRFTVQYIIKSWQPELWNLQLSCYTETWIVSSLRTFSLTSDLCKV